MDASFLTFDYLSSTGSCIVGDPDRCIEVAKRYQAAGCDLLLCMMQPFAIPEEKVLRSIELIASHVMPELA
jgi:alkanesulfonate monooxygenase SsuD/methylene tetrahydromethanopterin reductase-like flavin-dependent oxidoreductase (luciferase family)